MVLVIDIEKKFIGGQTTAKSIKDKGLVDGSIEPYNPDEVD